MLGDCASTKIPSYTGSFTVDVPCPPNPTPHFCQQVCGAEEAGRGAGKQGRAEVLIWINAPTCQRHQGPCVVQAGTAMCILTDHMCPWRCAHLPPEIVQRHLHFHLLLHQDFRNGAHQVKRKTNLRLNLNPLPPPPQYNGGDVNAEKVGQTLPQPHPPAWADLPTHCPQWFSKGFIRVPAASRSEACCTDCVNCSAPHPTNGAAIANAFVATASLSSLSSEPTLLTKRLTNLVTHFLLQGEDGNYLNPYLGTPPSGTPAHPAP